MNMNKDKLQFDRIKRIIQSAPCTFNKQTNSKLSYAHVKKIIESSPLERKKMITHNGSETELSKKKLDTLKDFCSRDKEISKMKLSETQSIDHIENVSVEPVKAMQSNKLSRSQIFVGKKTRSEKNEERRSVFPLARGESWITVKVD